MFDNLHKICIIKYVSSLVYLTNTLTQKHENDKICRLLRVVCNKKNRRKVMREKNKDRKILRSIGFTETQLDYYEELKATEDGSLAEHVRKAFDAYLEKKGFEI